MRAASVPHDAEWTQTQAVAGRARTLGAGGTARQTGQADTRSIIPTTLVAHAHSTARTTTHTAAVHTCINQDCICGTSGCAHAIHARNGARHTADCTSKPCGTLPCGMLLCPHEQMDSTDDMHNALSYAAATDAGTPEKYKLDSGAKVLHASEAMVRAYQHVNLHMHIRACMHAHAY